VDPAWLELLNSDWHDYRGSGMAADRLDDPVWRARFLGRWSSALRGVPDAEVVQALRSLRSLVRRLMAGVAFGRRVTRKDWNSLNAILSAAPLVRRLEKTTGGYHLCFSPAAENLTGVLAQIAVSFAEVLVHGDPTRIKLCGNPDCLWVFYDKSKSRTRRWCEGSGCGNLMKVRRFRARQKKHKCRPSR